MSAAKNIQAPVYLVNGHSDPVQVKIQGKASYTNCSPLSTFLDKRIKSGSRNFVLDFQDCIGMDSTFLGLMAGVALKLQQNTEQPGILCFTHITGRNLELVYNLGLHQLILLNPETLPPLSDEQTDSSDQKSLGLQQVDSAMVLRAHEILAHINKSNATKFQDVIAFLKKQLDDEQG